MRRERSASSKVRDWALVRYITAKSPGLALALVASSDAPILLLDDVFDKLDDIRVAQLIKLVSENSFGQVFITDTSRDRIRSIFDNMGIEHKIFDIPVPADVQTDVNMDQS